eukprot:GDKJ01020041.1.p1 GENE.GDKJ01020041.1~~GDKJ01020041.1.p1  ORF type:complete len:886 (-),score=270.21 GDKJ01020041.1:125-2398(-)
MKTLDNDNQMLNAQIKVLVNQLRDTEENLKLKDDLLSKCMDDLHKLNGTCENTTDAIDLLSEENHTLKKRVELLETENYRLKSNVHDLENQLDEQIDLNNSLKMSSSLPNKTFQPPTPVKLQASPTNINLDHLESLELRAKEETIKRLSRKLEVLSMQSSIGSAEDLERRESEWKKRMTKLEDQLSKLDQKRVAAENEIRSERAVRIAAEETAYKLREMQKESSTSLLEVSKKTEIEKKQLVDIVGKSQEDLLRVQRWAFEEESKAKSAVQKLQLHLSRLCTFILDNLGDEGLTIAQQLMSVEAEEKVKVKEDASVKPKWKSTLVKKRELEESTSEKEDRGMLRTTGSFGDILNIKPFSSPSSSQLVPVGVDDKRGENSENTKLEKDEQVEATPASMLQGEKKEKILVEETSPGRQHPLQKGGDVLETHAVQEDVSLTPSASPPPVDEAFDIHALLIANSSLPATTSFKVRNNSIMSTDLNPIRGRSRNTLNFLSSPTSTSAVASPAVASLPKEVVVPPLVPSPPRRSSLFEERKEDQDNKQWLMSMMMGMDRLEEAPAVSIMDGVIDKSSSSAAVIEEETTNQPMFGSARNANVEHKSINPFDDEEEEKSLNPFEKSNQNVDDSGDLRRSIQKESTNPFDIPEQQNEKKSSELDSSSNPFEIHDAEYERTLRVQRQQQQQHRLTSPFLPTDQSDNSELKNSLTGILTLGNNRTIPGRRDSDASATSSNNGIGRAGLAISRQQALQSSAFHETHDFR